MHGQHGTFSGTAISNVNRHLWADRDGALTACTPYSFTLSIIHFDSCNQFHVHTYISRWGPGEQSPHLEIIFDSSENSCAMSHPSGWNCTHSTKEVEPGEPTQSLSSLPSPHSHTHVHY